MVKPSTLLLNKSERAVGVQSFMVMMLWIDDWKKSIVYILLTAPCFTSKLRGGFSILAGTGFMFFTIDYQVNPKLIVFRLCNVQNLYIARPHPIPLVKIVEISVFARGRAT